MSSDYGYINARIRAMRSFLLKKEDYAQALRQRTEGEFISFLSSLVSYSNDLRQALLRQPLACVALEALKYNLCRVFRKIIKFSEGEPKELILILLGTWDIYNLKTIIRGLLSAQDKNIIIQTLMPIGKWDLEFLSKLVECKDLKLLANSLVTTDASELAKKIARLISNYSLASPLEILENNLQEAYFRNAQESLNQENKNARIVLEYLSFQIDFLNILLALNLHHYADKSHLKVNFFKGGRLKEAFLKDLLKVKAKEEALKLFEHSPYLWLAKEGLEVYKRSNSLSSLERLFKNKLFLFCSSLYTRGDPLSMSIPLAFINFKENEINNLRLIAKAISFGVPESLITQELIYA